MKKHINNKLILLIVGCMLLLTSCGAKNFEANTERSKSAEVEVNRSDGANYKSNELTVAESVDAQKTPSNLKIISTYEYELLTSKLEEAINKTKKFVGESGGYISNEDRIFASESSVGRYYAQIRIPKEKSTDLKGLFKSDKNLFTINSERKSTEEVSKEYFDQEVRLGVLEEKLNRLRELSKTQGELENLLAVEREISSTILEIESIKGDLKYLDDKVSMDTVNINISEKSSSAAISKVSGKTPFIQRIADTFVATWWGFITFAQNIVIVLISLLPYIILLVLFYVVFKKVFKKREGCPLCKKIKKTFKKDEKN